VAEILLRLSIAGLNPRMRTFDWQILHRPQGLAIELLNREIDLQA